MKKVLSIALVLVLLFSFPATVFATDSYEQTNENNESYYEYLQLVEEGILGEDISFEYWCEIVDLQSRLENLLEQSNDYHIVTEYSGVESSSTTTPHAEATPTALITWVLSGIRAGDIFITNATSSSGILGHAGIAVSPYVILHIAGPGQHPKLILTTTWFTQYENGWTKVYRHSNSTTASQAAQWAYDTYAYSNAEYQITMNLASTDVTYCSKLVWQAYYYGPNSPCANGPTVGVRLPYQLPATIHNVSLFASTE